MAGEPDRALGLVRETGDAAPGRGAVAPVAIRRALYQAVTTGRVVRHAVVRASVNTLQLVKFAVLKAAQREYFLDVGRGEKKDQAGAKKNQHQQPSV
jgi:hypothetical protein